METDTEKERKLLPFRIDFSFISLDTYKGHLTEDEIKRLKPYKPSYIEILGFTTNEYTSLGAWAHTKPSERTMCRLTPERTDYNLPVEVHEILHNLYPDASEEVVHEMAFDKSRAYEARLRARIKYR